LPTRFRHRPAPPRLRRLALLLTPLLAAPLWAPPALAQAPGVSPVRDAALPPASTASAASGVPESRGEPIELRSAPALQPPLQGEAAKRLPVILRADRLSGRPDLDTVAEGNAEFRRGGMVIRADRLNYQQAEDLAIARGNVRISREGNTYSGPELQLKVESFEGFFLNPIYHFARTGAGGSAERIDFLDEQRAVLTDATYTSCPADGSGGPAWMLKTDRLSLDSATNEGVAEGAVLRFYGVPILAAPRLSFPLTDERKSGWLPPSIGLDTKSGVQLAMPYYWDIAPNRDATITPQIATRRGVGVDSEFRYLEPSFDGVAKLDLLPFDQLTHSTRYALNLRHEQDFADSTRLTFNTLRVSDDDYWKDFPRALTTLTPRLLATDLNVTRPFGDDWTTYARIQSWQVLQTVDPTTRIAAPYERVPQIGARYASRFGGGIDVGFESEFNRFATPSDASLTPRITGDRVHVLASLARPFTTPGWTLTPKLLLNAASYALDQADAYGRRGSSRVIPTFSLDSAWVLERETRFFGREVRQTLEPRLLYVNTPYHDQAGLPNFDSAPKDFNFDSIFTENAFNGVDRVSDAHQVTAGVTTRLIDSTTGAETARFGLAQRYLLRDQKVTPNPDDPFTGVGPPLTQRLSDVLLQASTSVVPNWTFDSTLQYSPDAKRWERSVVSARYSPGPYRTVSATYRLTRGLSEQVELGWQWPIYGPTPLESSARSGGAGQSCSGSWYGVGRVNYSTLERRVIDSVVGVEYDAGCWIGRVVASRLSTGLSEATTRFSIQLEFVGLSRLNLGSNPLQSLKDNIPGFRLLRDDRTAVQPLNVYD
jgi:LPS-assembly protein